MKQLYALRICLWFAVSAQRRALRETIKGWRFRWQLAIKLYELREKRRHAPGTSRGRSRGS